MGDLLAIGCGITITALAVVASVVDVRRRLLPNTYTISIIAVALLGLTAAGTLNNQGATITLGSMALGSAWFAGPWLLTHLVAPKQIGFGDIKLAAGLGLGLGYIDPSTGFLGFFAAAVAFAGFMILTKATARQATAFGPALTTGAAIAAAAGLFN